ncbi:acyl-CoA dehydrogenase family protein [Roseateles asaccharophilus]|uniref:Alkylation response protein AidB-like acyl-CoA dehydrogenase n=1 Tax=Roseateles asaccharophilus TaxID=582607 RepID=A0ABU2A978_9BURK|nr:acyl-CoA dehydrogenase family protein [Roseateles asaccharophilus]MDR7333714.1 alkylation response protein AidB-like acyl-CoA dehydrogenase [Roseateles asaccharophilus]
MSSVLHFPTNPAPLSTADALALAEPVARQLAETAVARDQAGGHAARERELIRDSGLLALTVPQELGGLGASWPTFYRVLRRLAEADSALAHLFGFHHLQLASVQLYGTAEQQRRLLGETIRRRWFWGNALNPLDRRLLAVDTDQGWRLDGAKSFASGSVGADMLTFSAWHEGMQAALIGVRPADAPGISVRADWDAFGQKQTDSGTVSFDAVALPRADVLQPPGSVPTPRTTLRQQIAQLILVHLYVGIAQGALQAGLRFTRDESRPWFQSGVAAAVDDPFVQHRWGELWLQVRPAELLADAAAQSLQQALGRGDALTADERGAVAIAVAEAKVLAHRAALSVSQQLFELTGARATSGRYGLDRFWRNARVHTLHDPVDYKLRDLGRHALTGAWPEPTPYS